VTPGGSLLLLMAVCNVESLGLQDWAQTGQVYATGRPACPADLQSRGL